MKNHYSPSWLSRQGKRYYQKIVKEIPNPSNLQAEQMALLADSYDTFRMAAQVIQQDGFTIRSETGGYKPHPALSEKHRCASLIFKISKELGLLKSNLGGGDDLDEFLKG